ncbi:hypothetical protein KP509_31G054400 [Ceratopteris richardii]|uniref:Amino acid transporter transmembrane domain-containing protein n=1 Tax=Ceratopteris richardii TaxID=49495 RepID=A0A8T2QZL7_CERRI|nr:hypothetical protein KP509_31G054400 [Ceratopteris richardii]
MPEFSSSTLEGLRSMEKPAHRGEPRFDFTQLENQEDLEEQMKYISSASSVRTIHWPQSYERSMDLYSRSPPSVTGSNLLVPSEEKLQQHSSYHSHRVPKHNVSDVMLALLDDRGFEWSKKEPYEGASEVYEPQPEFQGQYVQDGDDNLQIGKSSLIQAIMNGVNALAGVGVLSTPYAVSQDGWIGLCFLLTFALVFCYTGFLLRRCLDLFPFLAGYPDVGQAAFGRLGRVLVSAFLYCELYAVAVEFLIMEGDKLSQLFPFSSVPQRSDL